MPSAELVQPATNGFANGVSSKPNAMDTPSVDHFESNSTAVVTAPAATEHKHIWMITGPAGCGKSTVAQYIANALSLPFLEGDSFHSPENVEKMRNNIPLTDQDRWDWLITLRTAALSSLGFRSSPRSSPSRSASPSPASSTTSPSRGVVVTCSALKQRYRDVMRIAAYNHPSVRVHFVYLHAPESVLMERVDKRSRDTNHFMPASMVQSQFQSLELPDEEETDVLRVDVSTTQKEVEEEALRKVREAVALDLEKDS